MKVGALTAAKADLPLEQALDFFAEAGVQAVELGTGNYPPNVHCNPDELLGNACAQKKLLDAVASRGLVISALSCHGNPIHPDPAIAKAHHEVSRQTIRLANELGITEVCGFSGLPGGGPDDRVPNWVTAPWPPDHLAALEYQWNEVAIPYWAAEAKFLDENNVNFCFEMHPNFLVYNPETLVKLREACGCAGKRICANFDPSHLFWQGIDSPSAIRWLYEKGDIIKHFHAKDSKVYDWTTRVNGVLDTKHYGDEAKRAWIFRTVGYGHGEDVWRDIISTLRMYGYDGVLSIEHEDSLMAADEGFRKAADILNRLVIFESPGAMTWA
jgi:sugar phosphate isomerase/epimerase